MKREKISIAQASLLLILSILPTTLLSLPSITCAEAGSDAWISLIISVVYGLFVLWVVTTLGLRFPEKTIPEYTPSILGEPLGKIIGLLYVLFYLFINSVIVREFVEFVASVAMPETPIIIFSTSIVLVSALSARYGLEVLARTSEGLFPVISLSFLILLVFSAKEVDLSSFLPFLSEGIAPSLKGSLPALSWMGEILAIGFLIPYINKPEKGPIVGIASIFVIAAFLLITLILAIGIFGATETGRLQFPLLVVARYISLGGVIERMESFVAVIWVAGVFMNISFYHFITCLGIAQWLGLRDSRALSLPLGTILVALSLLLFANVPELIYFLSNTWPPLALLMELGLPLFILLLSFLRKGVP